VTGDMVAISDDDSPGLRLSNVAVTVEENGTESFTVALTTRPGGTVTSADDTVARLVTEDEPTAGATKTLNFTASDWNTPLTVGLPGQDDAVHNPDGRGTTVTLGATGAARMAGRVRSRCGSRMTRRKRHRP